MQTVSKSLEQKSRDAKLDFASTTTENKFQGFFYRVFLQQENFLDMSKYSIYFTLIKTFGMFSAIFKFNQIIMRHYSAACINP